MNSFIVPVQLSSEQKARARRKIGIAWFGYWVLFAAMIVSASEFSSVSRIGAAMAVGWIAAWGYLLITISDCASRLGKSSIAWGGGMFVLGPLGALLLSGMLLSELKSN